MRAIYPVVTLGEVCSVGDGAHSKVERQDKGILYLTSKNIGQGSLKLDRIDYISTDDFERLFPLKSKATRRPFPGDVLMGIIGTFGNAYLYKETDSFGFASSIAVLRPNQGRLLPEFLYYVVTSKSFKFSHASHDGGSVQGYTNIPTIKSLPLPLPPINEQAQIAEILSSLDEKIELNRKQNHILEAIAQTLFKRWFVEFEFPDENGRPYKSSGGAMQPSELGEVPAGWRVGKLEELLGELETGSRPKGGVGQFTEGVPSVGAESITRIGEYDYNKTKYVPQEYFDRMRRGTIKDRDVLIYKDGGTPGRFDARISMFGNGFPFETACLNEHVFRLRADKPIYQNYLYLWLSSYSVIEELRHRGAKAAIPGINSGDVKGLDFLFMEEGLIEQFDEIIEPLFSKLLWNSRQNAALARIRDALLPKLMSGELRVGEATEYVKETV